MPRQQAQHRPVPLQPLQGDVAGLTSGRRRLSVRVSHALHRGGGDAHGHGDPLPQNRGGQVHHRHVPEHPGVQLPPGTHTNKLNFKRLQPGGNLQFPIGKSRSSCCQRGESCAGAGTKSHCVIQSCSKTPAGHKTWREQARRDQRAGRVRETQTP